MGGKGKGEIGTLHHCTNSCESSCACAPTITLHRHRLLAHTVTLLENPQANRTSVDNKNDGHFQSVTTNGLQGNLRIFRPTNNVKVE